MSEKRQIHLTMSEDTHKTITEKALIWHHISDQVPKEIRELSQRDDISRIRTAFVLSSITNFNSKSPEQQLRKVIREYELKLPSVEEDLEDTRKRRDEVLAEITDVKELYQAQSVQFSAAQIKLGSEENKVKTYEIQLDYAIQCITTIPKWLRWLLGIVFDQKELEEKEELAITKNDS